MELLLGVKSDPIENRYSWDWFFNVLNKTGIKNVQLGGFYEIPVLDDDYFLRLREKAEAKGVRFTSIFTAHREVHGWFAGDKSMERAAHRIYESLIHAGSLLGVDYVGSSAGSVLRDMMHTKKEVMEIYLSHMKELMHYAKDQHLKGLTIEVMSCLAEPPTLPSEIQHFMDTLQGHHHKHPDSTVQAYILGDISHGYADANSTVVHSNEELFECSIPYMCEFHFKNTDPLFKSTFGFSEKERARGIVKLEELKSLIETHEDDFPVQEVIGYLEHPGPKLGRDYTDYALERMLVESLEALQMVFSTCQLVGSRDS